LAERFQPRIGAAVIVSDRKIAKPSDLKARNSEKHGETMCVFESVEKQVKSGLGTFLRNKNFLALKAINLQWALRLLSLGHWLPLFRRHFWKQSHEAALCGGKFHN